eukprot:2867090-Rhodomonas_salina.2
MEDHNDTKLQAAMLLADGGALRVREELTLLQDIVTQLQEPLKAVTGTDQEQVTRSARQLESETKVQPCEDCEGDSDRPSALDLKRHYKSWTLGSQIQLNAKIDMLSDQQLVRCMEHHQYTFKLPADWYLAEWDGIDQDCYMLARKPVLSKKQLALGLGDDYVWWIRKLLDVNFSEMQTLEDCCLSQTTVEKVQQTVPNIWCRLPVDAVLHSPSESDTNLGESGGCSPTGERSGYVAPFKDQRENKIWWVLA